MTPQAREEMKRLLQTSPRLRGIGPTGLKRGECFIGVLKLLVEQSRRCEIVASTQSLIHPFAIRLPRLVRLLEPGVEVSDLHEAAQFRIERNGLGEIASALEMFGRLRQSSQFIPIENGRFIVMSPRRKGCRCRVEVVHQVCVDVSGTSMAPQMHFP